MLVLSRREGEKLVIGDNITLVVSRISGNRVTVGIEAPIDVKIFRGELHDEFDLKSESNSETELAGGKLDSRDYYPQELDCRQSGIKYSGPLQSSIEIEKFQAMDI